ncbi:unnamed protein product [Closterium sp. NIES-53]
MIRGLTCSSSKLLRIASPAPDAGVEEAEMRQEDAAERQAEVERALLMGAGAAVPTARAGETPSLVAGKPVRLRPRGAAELLREVARAPEDEARKADEDGGLRQQAETEVAVAEVAKEGGAEA